MKKYTFTCTCGDKVSVDAMDEADAKVKFAEVMTEEGAKAHFAEKHPGMAMPPYVDLMAGAVLTEDVAAPEAMPSEPAA